LIYPHGHRPVTGVRRHFVEGKKTCGARVDGLEPPTNVEPHGGSGRPSFWERPSRALPDRKGAHCGVSIRLCRLGGCQCNGKGEPQVGAGALAGLLEHPMPLSWALVFGALISPTDPVAVSTLKNVKVPPSLEVEIQGEGTASLTRGQLNAVRAAFKAGVTPARIARQVGFTKQGHFRRKPIRIPDIDPGGTGLAQVQGPRPARREARDGGGLASSKATSQYTQVPSSVLQLRQLTG